MEEKIKDRSKIKFSRIKNGLPIEKFSSYILDNKELGKEDIEIVKLEKHKLKHSAPWGSYFKYKKFIDEISDNKSIIKIREVAKIQIGLQTLAKDFFVISEKDKDNGIVEDEYLLPFAYSVFNFKNFVINEYDKPQNYIFYCSLPREKLANTNALIYIKSGESKSVLIRGKNIPIKGYQNKKRIQEAKRPFWYDVKTEVDKKEIAEILLPRFIFKDYRVLWNKAKYIPGGAVVQYFPFQEQDVDIRVSLAILTSTFTEIVFRSMAQVYGGGTSNIRISDLKEMPTIDISNLSTSQQNSLIYAFEFFLRNKDRGKIDYIINKEILCLSSSQLKEMDKVLIGLKTLATSAKKEAHPSI